MYMGIRACRASHRSTRPLSLAVAAARFAPPRGLGVPAVARCVMRLPLRAPRAFGSCGRRRSGGSMTHSRESAQPPDHPLPIDELTRHFDRHHVPERGRQLALDVFHGDPVRRVGGGGRSVVTRYASRKMRRVIQAESRNVELVFLEQCEYDPSVLFFFFLSAHVVACAHHRYQGPHSPYQNRPRLLRPPRR